MSLALNGINLLEHMFVIRQNVFGAISPISPLPYVSGQMHERLCRFRWQWLYEDNDLKKMVKDMDGQMTDVVTGIVDVSNPQFSDYGKFFQQTNT